MTYRKSIYIGISLILIVIILSSITFYFSQGKCLSGTFSCDNGNVCVPQRSICDGRLDCMDEQDENPTECGGFHGSLYITTVKFTNKTMNYMDCNITNFPLDDCSCRNSYTLFCGYNNFTEIPRISNEVRVLVLVFNSIDLSNQSFQHFTNLRKLHLENNHITNISSSAFKNLEFLQDLYLNKNKISKLPSGLFNNLISLKWLFLDSNLIIDFPLIELKNLQELKWLNLSSNRLTLSNHTFPHLKSIAELFLDNNNITEITENLFSALKTLQLLSLNKNVIKQIHPKAFSELTDLKELRIADNFLNQLPPKLLEKNINLDALILGFNAIEVNDNLLIKLNISYLNVDGIDFESINFDSIARLSNLKSIVYKKFFYCSMTPNIKRCRPNTDGISTLDDLLSKPVLRYSAWFMASLTCIGNTLVLWGRYTYHDENRAVSIVIRNLAVADFLMGIYLSIIGIQDLRYRAKYHEIASDWMASWSCAAAGVLAMTSSEVSLLILAFMSIERFLLIAFPFGGQRRLNMQNVVVFLLTIWLTGTMIAIIPLIYLRSSTRFYGLYSGTCFPLHIHERFPLGWQYSAVIFIGVNMFLLIIIATLYTILLTTIYRTRKATPLAMLDCEFAIRFFFIVLTDAACWFPIICMKIMALFSYEISVDVYSWLVVFILPLNSAINPILYTFTTPKYRTQLIQDWCKFKTRRVNTSGSAILSPGTQILSKD